MQFDFTKRFTIPRQREFAEYLMQLSRLIGFKLSARGWAYQLETERLINKDQFDQVEAAVNRCRRRGFLPIDFIAEEPNRQFQGVSIPSNRDGTEIVDVVIRNLEDVHDGSYMFTPDWWEGETYYIQVVVEKVDLITLFEPVCSEFKIPIASSKGWPSMLMRAKYAQRYAEAEQLGLKCVLLYCGDHDPDGLRISKFLYDNLESLKDIEWSDGRSGYDPRDLKVERFGLNFDLIEELGLTWIDNLITGGKKNLADPEHKNYNMPYVQNYLRDIGERKCEANALITRPRQARQFMRDTIERYLGDDASERFRQKRIDRDEKYDALLTAANPELKEIIEQTISKLKES